MKKFYAILLALALAIIPMSIAFAQDGTPPTVAAGPSFDWVGVLVKVAVALGVIAIAGERGTEVLKEILRQIHIPIQGGWSALLALGVAAVAIYYPNFNLEFFQQFELFKSVDPQLVNILNMVILWVVQNVIHQKGFLDGTFKATPVAEIKPFKLGKVK